MGLLSSSPSGRIHWREFEKILRTIPGLSSIERAYITGAFQDSLRGGLTKEELKREIKQMKHNPYDPLTSSDVEKVKQKLSERLK